MDNVWVGVTLQVPEGNVGEAVPLTIHEIVDGKPVNGFAITAQLNWRYVVRRSNLELHATTFLRIAESFGFEVAKKVGYVALELAQKEPLDKRDYLGFLGRYQELTSEVVKELLALGLAGDVFGLGEALDSLAKAVEKDDVLAAGSAHTTFVHKLDAYVTMLQKMGGDAADIMQTVAWQSVLYQVLKEKGLGIADEVIQASDEFVAAYQARKASNKDYPELLKRLFEAFRVTAEELGLELEDELAALKKSLAGSLAGMQKAHRDLLLKLYELIT